MKLPDSFMAEKEEDIINWIYGGGALCVDNADEIKDSCVLTPLNNASLEINHKVVFIEGPRVVLLSSGSQYAEW